MGEENKLVDSGSKNFEQGPGPNEPDVPASSSSAVSHPSVTPVEDPRPNQESAGLSPSGMLEGFDELFGKINSARSASRTYRHEKPLLRVTSRDVLNIATPKSDSPNGTNLLESLQSEICYGDLLVIHGGGRTGKRTAAKAAAWRKIGKSTEHDGKKGSGIYLTNVARPLEDCLREVASLAEECESRAVVLIHHNITEFVRTRSHYVWNSLRECVRGSDAVALVSFWTGDFGFDVRQFFWSPHFDWLEIFERVADPEVLDEARTVSIRTRFGDRLKRRTIGELERIAREWQFGGYDDEILETRLSRPVLGVAEELLDRKRTISERLWVTSACFTSGTSYAALDDCAKRLASIYGVSYRPPEVASTIPRRVGRTMESCELEGALTTVGKVDSALASAVLNTFRAISPGAYEQLILRSGDDPRPDVQERAASLAMELCKAETLQFDRFEEAWSRSTTDVYGRFLRRLSAESTFTTRIRTALKRRLMQDEDHLTQSLNALVAIDLGVLSFERRLLMKECLRGKDPLADFHLTLLLGWLAVNDIDGGVAADVLLACLDSAKHLKPGRAGTYLYCLTGLFIKKKDQWGTLAFEKAPVAAAWADLLLYAFLHTELKYEQQSSWYNMIDQMALAARDGAARFGSGLKVTLSVFKDLESRCRASSHYFNEIAKRAESSNRPLDHEFREWLDNLEKRIDHNAYKLGIERERAKRQYELELALENREKEDEHEIPHQ